MADCAVREVKEETGIIIRNIPDPAADGWSSSLSFPTAFAAADCIDRDEQGGIRFHYAIVEVYYVNKHMPYGIT